MRHGCPAVVAERCQAHHSAHAGGGCGGAGGSRRSPCRASAQLVITLVCFLLPPRPWSCCSVAMAVCSRPYAFHQRVYFAGWAGAALCHHRVWRPADCHLHHAGVSLYDQWYQQPVLLLLGAIWYNLLTLTGHLIFPVRPLQDNLARSYEQLAHYLELKSRLFDPDIEEESRLRSTIWLWRTASLSPRLTRQKRRCLPGFAATVASGTRRALHYYFAAQDIHERASSSHVQYAALREVSLQRRYVPLPASAFHAVPGVPAAGALHSAAHALSTRSTL